MSDRLLKLDDLYYLNSPDNIAQVFGRLGYSIVSTPLAIADLELSDRSAEAIWNAHLIADQKAGNDSLQVLLFQLRSSEWQSVGTASSRMKAIATSLCRRSSNFLLLGAKEDYDQLMLVNPRRSFDAQMNVKVGIRKLLIDRTSPTPYDRDRLEAIAAHHLDPQALYQRQCEAFDVEKLTKTFYQDYRKIFEQVQQVIRNSNAHPYFDDSSRLHQFSQRLLGRIMFLYFLQKKGFLAGDRNFLKNQYAKLRSEPEDTDFYSTVLEPLFFEMLNKQRPNFASPWGKIPYLNGGLFDRDYGVNIVDATNWATPKQIELPNSLFDPTGEKGILKFFGSYNFTVSENVQGDEDVAVDPEMLGKVFENMLAAEERGQSGTFYTPRGIVQFMCVESLSRYLADESGVDLEVVKQLTEYDAAADADLKKLLSKEQTRRLKQALETVKVCDPAVGSGAFPLGMMQVILTVRQAIAAREGMTVERGSLTLSEWKRNIIANNLYGVDIKPEAVEIAKLRLWLSLVVDIPTIDDVEPLPNLDYKLMCGNSLISTIHGERMIPDPTKDQQTVLAVTPVQAEIQKLVDLQQQYFHAQADERAVLKGQILEAEATMFRVAIADRRQHWQAEQRRLEREIRSFAKASRAQSQKQQAIEDKLKELNRVEVDVAQGLRSIDFFQWHLHFNEVFREKGGFDIVIGNPPYVRQEQIKDLKPSLQLEYDCYAGTADLFVYFYERGFQLLKPSGHLTYISSNKYMRSGYGEKLRNFLGSQGTIQHLIDFGDAPVFEAIAYPSILQAARTRPVEHQVRSLTWHVEKSIDDFASVFHSSSFLIAQRELTPDGWRLESPAVLKLLEKFRNAGQMLGEYANEQFFMGIKTGLNEAFIVDQSKRNELVELDPKCAEVIKPFLRGKDIRRWKTQFACQYIIFAKRGFSLEKYPSIKKHLEKYQEKLSNRATVGSHPWYELQQPQEGIFHHFESPKIIYPDIYEHQSFAVDLQGFYSANTAYFIPTDEIWLCGLLNSPWVEWFYSLISNKVRGGYLRAFSEYMKQIPIPQASPPDRQAISTLVQKCLDAKGQGVEQWEAEINNRVAHLYGLTADEIKQIEEGNQR